jgi:hypothetical protein
MNKNTLMVLLGVYCCLGAEAPLSLKNQDGQWLLLPPLVVPEALNAPATSLDMRDMRDMQFVDSQFVHNESLELPPVIQEDVQQGEGAGSYSTYMQLNQSKATNVVSPVKPD